MKKFKQSIVSIVIGLALTAGISWAAAIADPPNENIKAPINVSDTPQTKQGGLTVSRFTDLLTNALNGDVSVGTTGENNTLTVKGMFKVKGSLSSTIKVTGGTDSTVGSYTIRIFKIGDILNVTGGSIIVDYLVVGGGGGGGSYGGGGAGGYRKETKTPTAGAYLAAIGGCG